MATVRDVISTSEHSTLRELLGSYADDIQAARRYYQTATVKDESTDAAVDATNKTYTVEAVS